METHNAAVGQHANLTILKLLHSGRVHELLQGSTWEQQQVSSDSYGSLAAGKQGLDTREHNAHFVPRSFPRGGDLGYITRSRNPAHGITCLDGITCLHSLTYLHGSTCLHGMDLFTRYYLFTRHYLFTRYYLFTWCYS